MFGYVQFVRMEDEMSEEKTTETIQVEINKKMLAILNDVADSDGISVSDVVKKALIYYLKDYSRETRDWFVHGVIG